MKVLSTLILGILASLVAILLYSWWRRNRKTLMGPPKDLSSHFIELESAISKMPFLYERIEARVMDDFVGLEITPLHKSTLKPPRRMFYCSVCRVTVDGEIEYSKGQRTICCVQCGAKKIIPRGDERGPTERLKQSRKVLFLGAAGIGKTTFQRYTILTILKDKSKVEFLEGKESPIPFYVPLKAVANTAEFPILKYILTNSSFLSSLGRAKGLERLKELGSQGRLFLFLDGYDEIQFAAGQREGGFIQQELNLMMGTDRFPRHTLHTDDSRLQSFYATLSTCRIWLSSRWEFFEQNRLQMVSPDEYKYGVVSAVEIQGISDNRQNLIQKIFDKHKTETWKFDDLFNAEYFLHDIETSRERELVDLSYNPLFLTIMCFIYARMVMKEEKHNVNWASNFNDLIARCIHLLLESLDKDKISGEPPALQAALLARRGEFIEEKEEFLRYFAFKLFDDNTRLFDVEYIKDKAMDFFRYESNSSNKESILAGLTEDVLERPHIGWQLIYTGIFVLVDKQRQNVLYDFPHLRFRELLAAEYFINHDHEYLISNIEKGNLSELIYVFFNRSSSQEGVLAAIFKKLINNPDSDFLSALLINCLNRKPKEFSPSNAIRGFLLDCLNTDSFFTIRSDVLAYFKPDAEFIQEVADQFDLSLETRKPNQLLLSCHLLSRFEKAMFRDHVLRELLPKFQVTNAFLGGVVINHKDLAKTIKQMKPEASLEEFFRLSEIFDFIKRENKSFKWPKPEPEYCYLVTDRIIQGIPKFIQSKRVEREIEVSEKIGALGTLKFKLFFSDGFLSSEFKALDQDVKEYIIEQSRIEYKLCRDILTTLEHVKKNPPPGAFFN